MKALDQYYWLFMAFLLIFHAVEAYPETLSIGSIGPTMGFLIGVMACWSAFSQQATYVVMESRIEVLKDTIQLLEERNERLARNI